MAKLPRVLILYTGGTFGMDESPLTLPRLSPSLLGKRLRDRVPELTTLASCDIDIALNRDSAHVGPDEWASFADRIRSRWRSYDGVVVLHGTDTLAYTASALSFLLRPCTKPVVITGAQRPLAAIRTDARRNLISAVEIAARGPRPEMNRVSVFFDDGLFAGNRVRKRSASEFAGFDSPKAEPLAHVGTEIAYSAAPPVKSRAPQLLPNFSRKVALVHATPGFPARAYSGDFLETVDGLVLVVFPSVTAPTHDRDFLALLKRAKELGKPVIVVAEGSRRSNSRSKPAGYRAGLPLFELGCLPGGDLTPECAFVKASWILGQEDGAKRFASLWRQDFAEES